MIDLRKLVALDMAIHGTRFIVAELAIGVILSLIMSLVTIRSYLTGSLHLGWALIGIWLLGISANYVPLFIYAVLIARAGTVKEEGLPEMVHVKRYTVQQVIIFVPFLVLIIALVQESRRRQRG